MKIEVIKDTTIIKDNTADSLAVVLTKEEAVTEYETSDGKIIKGDNLVVEQKEQINLGELKLQLSTVQANIDQLEAKKIELQTLIDSIQPEVDKAISEILAENPIK